MPAAGTPSSQVGFLSSPACVHGSSPIDRKSFLLNRSLASRAIELELGCVRFKSADLEAAFLSVWTPTQVDKKKTAALDSETCTVLPTAKSQAQIGEPGAHSAFFGVVSEVVCSIDGGLGDRKRTGGSLSRSAAQGEGRAT